MSTTSRQQPGLACEECRKRKLRCDRGRPQCSVCQELDMECIVNSARSRRGPKKGHLKALRSRIAALETLVDLDKGGMVDDLQDILDFQEGNSLPEGIDGGNQEPDHNIVEKVDTMQTATPCRAWSPTHSAAKTLPTPTPEVDMSDAIEAELDELYFDRAHIIVPIIHRSRYLAWSKQPNITESQACLRWTMWTLAASASTYLQHMRESLYASARSRLTDLDNNIEFELGGAPTIEQAQAWLLLAHYEFRYMHYQRAWITAGRAFRIIQLCKLHEIDRLNHVVANLTMPDIWVEAEERRRTFWLAYCLDHFINISHEWPLSLREDTIWTCLPAPEADFQHSRPVQTGFLSGAIESSGQCNLSPFAEVVISTTLCWCGLSLKRLVPMDDMNSPRNFQAIRPYYTTLFETLHKRVAALCLPSSSAELLDPMRLFANMLGHASIVWFYTIMERWRGEMDDRIYSAALASTREIANLAELSTRSSVFKAHPFSPMLVYIAAKFLKMYSISPRSQPPSPCDKDDVLGRLKLSLQALRSANKLAAKYMDILDSELLGEFWEGSDYQFTNAGAQLGQSPPLDYSSFLDLLHKL